MSGPTSTPAVDLFIHQLAVSRTIDALMLLDEQDQVAFRPRHATRGVTFYTDVLLSAVLAAPRLIIVP